MIVLVIEDDPGLCEAFCRYFQVLGMEVRWARDAEQAGDELHSRRFDIVLTDVMMPGNGHTILEYVQNAQPDAVIIVMSSFESEVSAVRRRHGPAFEYLTKPVGPEQLSSTLQRALAQRH